VIPASIIAAKRDGRQLTDDEIEFFVQGFAAETIPDYQMSALAMAIFLNGMSASETASLTQQMLDSGTRLRWPNDGCCRVDKHSTGGVGDKVSIPLAPLLACCGLQVPMLSGRGLGATGGTLDKLEAIPGFRTNLSLAEIQQLTQEVGCVITGASAELAPADRRLYALRDVTATVPSIPLITASIMSKKLAESLDALVLDVKFGSGAFMKSQQQATLLAESLVQTGRRMGVKTTAMLTDMNQPLGRMCGNAVEVQESLATLQGGGPSDVRQLTIELAADLLVSSGIEPTRSAFGKYEQMIVAQGGDPNATLQIAPASSVGAKAPGVVTVVDTNALGLAIIAMGGGRQLMADRVDHSVGLEILVRVGDKIEAGQPLLTLFSQHPERHADAVRNAITIGSDAIPPPLIVHRM
jgi:pyrimidine-nucleoside phosphorylase